MTLLYFPVGLCVIFIGYFYVDLKKSLLVSLWYKIKGNWRKRIYGRFLNRLQFVNSTHFLLAIHYQNFTGNRRSGINFKGTICKLATLSSDTVQEGYWVGAERLQAIGYK